MSTINKLFHVIVLMSMVVSFQNIHGQTYGCTDSSACNFDPSATIEDNSCNFPQWFIPAIALGASGPAVQQCTPPAGYIPVNQNCASSVINNDPYCFQTTWDNICQNAFNLCTPSGCTDTGACNYDQTAVLDDGSCSYGSFPQIFDVSIVNLDCTGGQTIDVIGSDFCGIESINILGQNLTFIVISSTHLQCISPPGSGNTDLKITTPAGIASFPISYAAPTLDQIVPASINCTGSSIVSVAGTNLCDATVFINDVEVSVTSNGFNSLTFLTLPGTGVANILITTPSGSIETSIEYSAPVIQFISPTFISCTGSFVIDISGSNLCGAQVFFGNIEAQILGSNSNFVLCSSVAGTGSTSLTIVTPSGTSNSIPITYFPPTISASSLSVFNCSGGQQLDIVGNNLCSSTVTIGGVEAIVTNNTNTQISAVIPPGSGNADIVVTSASGVSNTLFAQYSPESCADPTACNYDSTTDCGDNNSCLYLDCNGDCGGLSITDDCGNCVVPDISEVVHTFAALDQEQIFILPQGIDRVTLELYGASGGRDRGASNSEPFAAGGFGGYVYGEMDVTSNVFFINVGRREDSFNGGGSGIQSIGGGATSISQGGNSLANRIAVAGGGGGGRFNGIAYQGGAGGGLQGGNGTGPDGGFGTGGTQSSPGTGLSNGNGISFIGGSGQSGGGGGWFGGGAGQSGSGGGGSSYLGNLENANSIPGVNDGDGYAVIRYYVVDFQNSCIPGCTASLAVNYDIHATFDDSSCIFAGCTDPLANNFDTLPTLNDGSCIYNEGCTYPEATNYVSFAVVDDGSCAFQPSETCLGDLNGDNVVNGADLLGFLSAFNTSCE